MAANGEKGDQNGRFKLLLYFYNVLLLKAKSWTNGSEPVVPSFALMYLKTERGRPPQIVWTGKANNS